MENNIQNSTEDVLYSQFELGRKDSTLQLQTAALYVDGRAHFVFSDNTAIILHTKGDCVTFFSKSGAKTRSLVNYVVNSTAKTDQSGGVSYSLDKLAVAIKFFNYYTTGLPLIQRKDTGSYELIKLFTKYKTVQWPGQTNVA